MFIDSRKRRLLLAAVSALLLTATFVLVTFSEAEQEPERTRDAAKPKENQAKADKLYMQFDDFLNGKFRASSFYPNWVSGNEYISKKDAQTFVKINIETEKEDNFVSGNIVPSNIYSWSVSPDQMYMAIHYNQTDGFIFYLQTFSTRIIEVATSKEANIPNFPTGGIQQFKWSSTGHSFAYVQGFNVYAVKDFSTETLTLTSDGDEQLMFNGVFEGDIVESEALFWWSTNDSYLAYAKINQSGVMPYEFSVYDNLQYPKREKYPYPKAGTPIPQTTVVIVDVATWKAYELSPSEDVRNWKDYHINSALWRSDKVFTITWKNRLHNESISENCIFPDFNCSHQPVMMESSTTGWVGNFVVSFIYPSSHTSEYFTVRSFNKFPHLFRIDLDNNATEVRTSGDFEVTDTGYGYKSIYYYDDVFDWVYFTSTEQEENPNQGLPRIRHMWRVKGHGEALSRECITCQLNILYPNRCNWVTPSFSKDGSFVVVNCGGTANGVPVSTLHKKSDTGDYNFVRVVEDNTELQQALQDYYFRERIYGSITLPELEGEWYYTLHKPPNFDPTKKYPMLVQVYSAPGWQLATDKWEFDWARSYIASSDLDVIVMTFDGRGTGFRGDDIRHMVYRIHGQYEPLDQIEATRKVSKMYDYIDETRTAVWGRGGGGYTTARTIGEDTDQVYKCGFAVAPVTDWTLYHSIYIERYMGLPTGDNEDGYSKSTAMQKYENFGKHYFVLVHGTSNSNVHMQNSARLSKALIEKDVDFGNYFAADEWHGFNHLPNGYAHHYKLLTHHLKVCFNL